MEKADHNVTTSSSKKRPPAAGDPVTVRLQPDMAKGLDDWRRRQEDLPGRPEAIRRLIELGLRATMDPVDLAEAETHAAQASKLARELGLLKGKG